MNMASLSVKNSARPPRTYEVVCAALAGCQNINECKERSDKAATLASYAKQSHHVEIERQAQLIRVRAVQRVDELRSQIQAQSGGDKKSGDYQGRSGHTVISQAQSPRSALDGPTLRATSPRVYAARDDNQANAAALWDLACARLSCAHAVALRSVPPAAVQSPKARQTGRDFS